MTNATRRNHFSTFFQLCCTWKKTKHLFPPERELWLTPGMGMGGGQQIPNIPPKSQKIKQIPQQIKQIEKTLAFSMCSPWKGNLTDAGDGDGGAFIYFSKKRKEEILLNVFYTIWYILCISIYNILYIQYICIFWIFYIFCIFCICWPQKKHNTHF